MIIRVVKLNLRREGLDVFMSLFLPRSEHVRNFPGCQYLQLWKDVEKPDIYFSYSWWESPAHLEAYRKSEVYKEVWALLKSQFGDRPEAWTVEKILELP